MSTPLHLLKFPDLVCEKVFGNFDVKELFKLSLCSSLAANAVRHLAKSPLPNKINVFNSTKDDGRYRILVVEPFEIPSWMQIDGDYTIGEKFIMEWNFQHLFVQWADGFRGMSPDCVKLVKTVVDHHNAGRYDLAVRDVFAHLHFIFPNMPIGYVAIHSDGPIRHLIPSLEKCEMLDLDHKIPVKEAVEILGNVKVSDRLRVNLHSKLPTPININLNCEHIQISKANWITREQFLSMKSKHIELTGTKLSTDDLQSFIRQWKSSEDRTFEYLKIRLVRYNKKKIVENLEEFEPFGWEKEMRQCHFSTPDRKGKVDCSKGWDILREDGLLASIVLDNCSKFVYFVVWHKRFGGLPRGCNTLVNTI